jgi:hypothetical protein
MYIIPYGDIYVAVQRDKRTKNNAWLAYGTSHALAMKRVIGYMAYDMNILDDRDVMFMSEGTLETLIRQRHKGYVLLPDH